MLVGVPSAQALGFFRRHLPAHRDDDRSVGERWRELANQAEGLWTERREQPRGDRRPFALTDFDEAVALEPAAQDALPLVLLIEDPSDLIKDQRWPLSIDAAVDRRLRHAVGFLAATAEPIEHRH